jgi:ribosomal silencing factor RsfS
MSNAKHILPNQEHALNEEQLLNYVANNLSNEQRNSIEMEMEHNPFMNDAIEGLQAFKDEQKIQAYVNELNKQLIKQTTKKKIRKSKRKLKEQDWIIISVIIVIMLCLLGYIVVNKLQ